MSKKRDKQQNIQELILHRAIAGLKSSKSGERASAVRVLGYINAVSAVPMIIELLGDEDYKVRERAASALGSLGDRSAVKPLIGALSDEHHRVRWNVCDALGALGDTSAVPALLHSLQNPREDIRERNVIHSIGRALGKLSTKSLIPQLIDILNTTPNIHVQISVIGALGDTGDPLVLPVLKDKLQAENDGLRCAVLFAVKKIDPVFAAECYLNTLQNDPHYYNRVIAAAGLANLAKAGLVQITPVLLQGLDDEYDETRAEIANTLRHIGDTAAVPVLMEHLGEDSRWASDIVFALALLGGQQIAPQLLLILHNHDEKRRLGALRTLISIKPPDLLSILKDTLDDEEFEIRRTAVHGLAEVSDAIVVPLLMELIKDEHPKIRHTAAVTMGEIANNEFVPVLLEGLKDPDFEVRIAIIDALGSIGDYRANDTLKALIRHKSTHIRQAAAYSLSRLARPGDLSYFLQLLNNEEAKICRSAISALWHIYETSSLRDDRIIASLLDVLLNENDSVSRKAYDVLQLVNELRQKEQL